jgi:lysophospholipase L1-like esterase
LLEQLMTPIRIVFMGDSITAGQYVDPSKTWTAHVEGRLHRRFGADNIVTVTRGVSGETTRQGLERFPASVQNEAPDIVTIQYGLNDCNCWQTDKGLPRVGLRAYMANLAEMIDRSRRFGAREIILMTNHRTLRRTVMVSGEVFEDASIRYSHAAREVANEAGVTLCDQLFAFTPLTDDELNAMLLPPPDSIHLSETGHVFYGDNLYPYLEAAINISEAATA